MKPLAKAPELPPSRDYYRLRREGIGHIQDIGSDTWSDYNVACTGIAIHEALCYAITDVGYRTQWRIQDLLTPSAPAPDPRDPYPDQAFFTSRTILTVNPTTPNDLRRVLIDLPGVRDAWVLRKDCACEASYWAWCDQDQQLILQYGAPTDPPHPAAEIWAHGLQDILLELDHDPVWGDLNDRMVVHQSVVRDSNGTHPITLEVRFPAPSCMQEQEWALFLDKGQDAVFANSDAFVITLLRLGATRTYNLFDLPDEEDQDEYLRKHWNEVFYASVRIEFGTPVQSIDINAASVRILAGNSVRKTAKAEDWRALIVDTGPNGFVTRYRHKAKAVAKVLTGAKKALGHYRNLGEDHCHVSGIGIEDVAVCADIEASNDADIEQVQGAIWFALEQYMAPPIPFRTLQELRERGVPVDDIFNGPALDNGFIEDTDLEAATLKPMLRASDMIRLLMDIDGVEAVKQLRMTKYDAEGQVVTGTADPNWIDGQPVYEPVKLSAAWLLSIRARHQPRLYLNQSNFVFYKDELPFRPRFDEARDTLNQLRGQTERPKRPKAPKDLPAPPGTWKHPQDYFPVQYSFPLTYGIGPDGLPPHAKPERQAQARNLKAYLMVFEQLLGNTLAQLAHTADLFSLDPTVAHTCFAKTFDDTLIKDLGDIADLDKLRADAVTALLETPTQFLGRRNHFLDHLLARFGENFSEYALLLNQSTGQAVAQSRLIDNKIAFLGHYPKISSQRARAFDYREHPSAPGNVPGIKQRINLLLGYPDLHFIWPGAQIVSDKYLVPYILVDGIKRHHLEGSQKITADNEAQARQIIYRQLLDRMIVTDAYAVDSDGDDFALVLRDADGTQIGHSYSPLPSRPAAEAARDTLRFWAAGERMLVVEHILLRPKFIGDALYPACCDHDCTTCDSADPYSFRLTCVMPGWTEQYTDNLDLRRYAERTVQREMPAHLLAKTCWVGNDGYVENPCAEVVDKLCDLLADEGRTASHEAPTPAQACQCATRTLHAFSEVFTAWFEEHKFVFLHKRALPEQIKLLFQDVNPPAAADCAIVFTPSLWDAVRALMRAHFVDISRHGWQFERFEWAWYQWLEANASINWPQEQLVQRVHAILAAASKGDTLPPARVLCECARRIVTEHGAAFRTWMDDNLAAGNDLATLTPFIEPPVTLCPNLHFAPATQSRLAMLLAKRYARYVEPSYWLSIVVTLLADLRNTYPDATLHDCDEGSDINPVRLDNTALGNYPNRTTL